MPEDIIRNTLSEIYKGALTENYVAQTLTAGGYHLYYWTDDAPVAEIDFLIQKEGKIIPVEVKSGENVNSKSLKHFQKLAQPEKMIRLSRKNFGSEGAVWAIPLYAAFCL